jgi:hypothetical protein
LVMRDGACLLGPAVVCSAAMPLEVGAVSKPSSLGGTVS